MLRGSLKIWMVGWGLVPQGRIELPTSPLPRVRSATELLRRDGLMARDCATVSANAQVPALRPRREIPYLGAAEGDLANILRTTHYYIRQLCNSYDHMGRYIPFGR